MYNVHEINTVRMGPFMTQGLHLKKLYPKQLRLRWAKNILNK